MRPHAAGAAGQPPGFLHRGEVALLINTTRSCKRKMGATHIRRLVLHYNLPYCTTVEGAQHYVQSFTKFGFNSPEPVFKNLIFEGILPLNRDGTGWRVRASHCRIN